MLSVKSCLSFTIKHLALLTLVFSLTSVSIYSDNIFSSINEKIQQPKKFVSDHEELFGLMRCLLHLPYILTLDSTDINTIKAAAACSWAVTGIKLSSELMQQHILLKTFAFDGPKAGIYGLGMLYDIVRFLESPSVALKNKIGKNDVLLKSLKKRQMKKIATEGLLRVLAYGVRFQMKEEIDKNENYLSFLISNLADIVEIWRLLERFETSHISLGFDVVLDGKNNIDNMITIEEKTDNDIEALLNEICENNDLGQKGAMANKQDNHDN